MACRIRRRPQTTRSTRYVFAYAREKRFFGGADLNGVELPPRLRATLEWLGLAATCRRVPGALDLVGRGRVEGHVAGHAVTTIANIVQREKGAAEARTAHIHLLSRVRVAPVTDSSVRMALTMPLGDFEDAVCAASAQEAGCTVIVTRNPRHFQKVEPPAILPGAFLASQSEPKG